MSLFTETLEEGAPSPEVRGYFAEFLSDSYLVRLRLFIRQPVSVLVRSTSSTLRGSFLATDSIAYSFRGKDRSQTGFSAQAFDSRNPLCYDGDIHHPRNSAHRVTPSLPRPAPEYRPDSHRLRFSASPTGPAYPGTKTVAQETFGFRRTGFSPVLSFTHVCILTSMHSTEPSDSASARIERFPTTRLTTNP